MTDDDRAIEHLDVSIQPHRDHPVRNAGRFVVELVGSVLMGDLTPRGPGADLVVVRREGGAEVLRTFVSSTEEADQLLGTVRRDLEQKSVAEFVDEWHNAN